MNPTKEMMKVMAEEAKSVPFKKKGLLARSPIKKRTGSFSEIERRVTLGKDERQAKSQEDKKRKRTQDGETKENKTKAEERTTVQVIKDKVNELVSEIEGQVLKTAKMEVLAYEIRELVEQIEIEESIKREEEENGGELKTRRKIRGLISKTDTYDKFKELESETWPKECYERTKIKTGIFQMNEGDIILLRDENDDGMEFGAAGRLKESSPELLKMKESDWETLALSSRRITEKTRNETWEKNIHVGRKTNDEELFNQFLSLKEHMNKQGRKKGILPVDKGYSSPDRIAKMLECAFKNSEIKIDLYCWEGDVKDGSEKRPFRSNAIFVKTAAENYANTLKNIKEEICQSGKHIELRKIGSARDGNMIIELNEGDTGEEVMEILTKTGHNNDIRLLDKEKTNGKKYIIRDLDAITTKDEIIKNLKDTTTNELEKETIKLTSMRRAPGETQVAIVQLNKDHAERINGEGGITMGPLKIKLREWMVIDRCFKCWEHGHRAVECTGPDRSSACLKCGKKDGHNAKTCQNEVYCPICQREGYRAGSGACPKMKIALDKLRKQERGRRRATRR